MHEIQLQYMTKKMIWCYAVVIFSCNLLCAQSDILYDLDAYKQVTFRLDQLLLRPDGGISSRDFINVPGAGAIFNPDIGLDVSYSRIVNNESRQSSFFHRADVGVADTKSISLDSRLTMRSYVDNSYLLTGYDGSVGYYDRVSDLSNIIAGSSLEVDIEGNFGFGSGRMEYINHAWMATLLLQALQDQALLLRSPEVEEITELADMLGRVRRARILDSRMRSIEILERIVSHLQERKFIDPLSATAILIIQDTYRYDEIANRQTGSRLEFAIQPRLFVSRNKDQFNQENNRSEYGAVGSITYLKEKNMDVRWSKVLQYAAVLTVNQFSQSFQSLEMLRVKAAMTYQWSMAYLPSARTNFRYGLNSEIFVALDKREDFTDYTSVNLDLQGFLSYNYWFSPRTRAQITSSVTYYDDQFQFGKYQPTLSGNVAFSVVHAIM